LPLKNNVSRIPQYTYVNRKERSRSILLHKVVSILCWNFLL